MNINEIKCKSILSGSKLYGVDYSVNPYVGCGHGCKYCYAVFMKKFTGHEDTWGRFVDVKVNAPEILVKDLMKKKPGSILLSSVTDAYQAVEKKYKITRKIVDILSNTRFSVSILTKSDLVLRDLDIIKTFSFGNISVGFTINFLDDQDREIWEPYAPGIHERIDALKKMHKAHIPTYVHVGPYFKGITNLEQVIKRVKDYIYEFQIETLNMRREKLIKKVVRNNYPHLRGTIYRNDNMLKRKVNNLQDKYDFPILLFTD